MPEVKELIAKLQKRITGYMRSCVVYAFAELELADLLLAEPLSLNELSRRSQSTAPALERLLFCAADLDLVEFQAQNQTWRLTDEGRLLAAGVPGSQKHFARLMLRPDRYQPWGHLSEIVRRGSSAGLSAAWQSDSYELFRDDPNALADYHQGMSEFSRCTDEALAESYDFSNAHTIVELGAGDGGLMAAVLRHHPGVQGIAFDIDPWTGEGGDQPANFSWRQGDFFKPEEIPPADIYLLKNVVHNFSQERKVELFQALRQAIKQAVATGITMGAKPKVIVIEQLPVASLPSSSAGRQGNWMDLHLFILNDGGKLKPKDYAELASATDFTLEDIIPGPENLSLLVFSTVAQFP